MPSTMRSHAGTRAIGIAEPAFPGGLAFRFAPGQPLKPSVGRCEMFVRAAIRHSGGKGEARIAGEPGADAKHYQEKAVKAAIEESQR